MSVIQVKKRTFYGHTDDQITDKKPKVPRDEIFSQFEQPFGFPRHVFNRLILIPEHLITAYFLFYVCATNKYHVPIGAIVFEQLIYSYLSGLGVTVGCHRYWAHKTFKAKLPLQYLLMALQTVSFQYSIYQWCLDHRIHHKYTDTTTDPHNSSWGFWYSHMGWVFRPRTEEFLAKSQSFTMPDLENDPVVRFQSKYYWRLVFLLQYFIPMAVNHYFWEVPLFYCLCLVSTRHVIMLHITWCVNSFAHLYGDRPYTKNIRPTENALVAFITLGEGWHNYHHTFPWDYKCSEFGPWKLNPSTLFINFFGAIGWAYDMKTVSQKTLKQRLLRTGDANHNSLRGGDSKKDLEYPTMYTWNELMETMERPAWGWDDTSISDEFRKVTKILRPSDSC